MAVEITTEVKLPHIGAYAHTHWGHALAALKQYEKAVEIYEEDIDIYTMIATQEQNIVLRT